MARPKPTGPLGSRSGPGTHRPTRQPLGPVRKLLLGVGFLRMVVLKMEMMGLLTAGCAAWTPNCLGCGELTNEHCGIRMCQLGAWGRRALGVWSVTLPSGSRCTAEAGLHTQRGEGLFHGKAGVQRGRAALLGEGWAPWRPASFLQDGSEPLTCCSDGCFSVLPALVPEAVHLTLLGAIHMPNMGSQSSALNTVLPSAAHTDWRRGWSEGSPCTRFPCWKVEAHSGNELPLP